MNQPIVKNISALLIILVGAAIVVAGFLPPRTASGYDLTGFGQLPVQYGTRVLPIDSVARNTLRLFAGRTVLRIPDINSKNQDDKIELPALQWFLDLALRPEAVTGVKVFRVDNDEALGLIGQKQQGSQWFSFRELGPHFDEIANAAKAASLKKQGEQKLSPFEDEVSGLYENLQIFEQLAQSFVPSDDPAADWVAWEQSIKPGLEAVRAHDEGKPVDQNLLDAFAIEVKHYMDLENVASVGLIPPVNIEEKWSNLAVGARDALRTFKVSPVLHHYAAASAALRKGDVASFNTAVGQLHKDLDVPGAAQRARFEAFLNNLEPFYRGSILYVMAFLCACIGWLAWGPELRRAALWLIAFGFALQLLGLAARVYLTGYWIVTSLYSSALFVGFVVVLAGLVIELLFKRGIGAALASAVGFVTLVIAHNLPFGGDDLARPQAVLATNLWLSTHVMCITIGYAAMFVAGAIGIGYVLIHAFSARPDRELQRLLARLVYGVTCFATLFSFVGTMLGGIWADQSWGRFWGWDPKENGALLIVLWCAICLHARWGKLVSERAQMALALGGNMVTAWSWFGVNLLGVGLHSYGFMQGTFWTLLAFWLSQLALIALALLPGRFWASKPAAAVSNPA